MEKYIMKVVEKMIRYHLIHPELTDEYVYALTCISESTIVIGTILFISILIGRFIPTLCFLFFFYSLRKRSDGYHAKTFLGCYIMSILSYLCVVIWSNYVYLNMELQCIILGITSIIIFIIGSVIHPNMQMNPDEIMATKKAARLVLILEDSIILFSLWMWNCSLEITYMTSAVAICCICLLIAILLRKEEAIE